MRAVGARGGRGGRGGRGARAQRTSAAPPEASARRRAGARPTWRRHAETVVCRSRNASGPVLAARPSAPGRRAAASGCGRKPARGPPLTPIRSLYLQITARHEASAIHDAGARGRGRGRRRRRRRQRRGGDARVARGQGRARTAGRPGKPPQRPRNGRWVLDVRQKISAGGARARSAGRPRGGRCPRREASREPRPRPRPCRPSSASCCSPPAAASRNSTAAPRLASSRAAGARSSRPPTSPPLRRRACRSECARAPFLAPLAAFRP
jgi:hypothetical protein